MPEEKPKWITPKNVLIAFLLLVQTATMLWLEWNQIDMQRHPSMTIGDLPVVIQQPKVKP